MTPPLFTGKVWIGSAYQRKLPNLVESKDAQRIQLALLNDKEPSTAAQLLKIIIRLVAIRSYI